MHKPFSRKLGRNTSTRKKSPPRAKPFWFDPATGQSHDSKVNERCVYFHSILEFKVYCDLKHVLGNDVLIIRQYPVLYKPATDRYSPLYWRVDFCLRRTPSSESLYVEVKGEWLLHDSGAYSEFKHKLQFLEYCNAPVYENLILVGEDSIKLDKYIQAVDADEAIQLIQEKLCLLKPSKS